ncbi:LysM peptidoglycan-binding domain-containing protein [Myxococcus qinghaiensis]|uniref:LysM peptidoglycan-binding domain-containing protein n=1 Tax=Myxococcus qinghaiensis TaxID=2906758 RepID=UPI0020A73CE4|nr:hypothetical protein [Myxococcus qinghaiensis]
MRSIAARFYGDASRSPLIAEANQLSSPEQLDVGTELTIPDVDLTPLPVFKGRPATEFKGALPYATEVFGVYQPMAGWFGRRPTLRLVSGVIPPNQQDVFSGRSARQLADPFYRRLVEQFGSRAQAMLSPVGLVTLFRQYFFEFDTFLGVPTGHLWISPGGTVEVVESSTRRTLVERTAEQSEEATRKSEESLTSQEDVADAIKEDNANDTTLGASASAGAKFAGIYHADASASLSVKNTIKKSSELTHKHARTQSAKVSSEIHRNFKTTFKVVTETTDTSSRRYVVQNTTAELVNYELRRKMRKVGVQVQHIGTRLSWQVFLDVPGKDLGLGELVHVVPAPDLSSIKKPEVLPRLEHKFVPFAGTFPITKVRGTAVPPNINMDFIDHAPNSTTILDAAREMHIVANIIFNSPPPAPGYTLASVGLVSAKSQGSDITFVPQQPIEIMDRDTGVFQVFADRLNTGNLSPLQLAFSLTWDPPAVDPAKAQYDADMSDYNAKVAEVLRAAYAGAVRDRLKWVSGVRLRPSEDLRSEERQSVFGNLIRRLRLFEDPHIDSELIRQIFDVDEMLYFVAPEYWRPSASDLPMTTQATQGKYPVPRPPSGGEIAADHLAGDTVVSWYSHTAKNNALDQRRVASDEWRVNYLITEDTHPAPKGSSLGWLIQIDGDERRNEFLNAAWVKAVLPIRPGHELEALGWLAQANVEGEAGLDQPYLMQPGDPDIYQGKTLGQVLTLVATELQASNTDMSNTLATEEVFERGFDPLEGGFRPAEPYEVFDQWLEVLPTDQVVAVAVKYDPKTGKQL